jgi:8-oxo-dGTP pyrophosphatase MutT (NUDIX family)
VTHPYDDRFRADVSRRCAAFDRQPAAADTGPLKPAAVAIALVDTDGGAGFVLTRRAARLRAHSGQWALPGGRRDAGETPQQAALRELHEEIGLALDPGDVLGVLDDYPTRSGYLITPVVVWVGQDARMQPNPDEVSSVHRIPLAIITDADAFEFVEIPESPRRVVRFRLDAHRIHAPTAAVLYQFREVIAGRDTRVADLEQPPFAWR